MGYVGSKTMSLGQFLEKKNICSLDPVFMIFVRMFILMKSRPELKMGHVGSKTRSLGKFLEKQCQKLLEKTCTL